MIGAIIGDVIGSPFERLKIKHCDNRLTDDSYLTIALADSILSGIPYETKLKEYYDRYPEAGYGDMFARWAQGEFKTNDSWGNGAIIPPSFNPNLLCSSFISLNNRGKSLIPHSVG